MVVVKDEGDKNGDGYGFVESKKRREGETGV